jgi:hypothetical protein
MNKNKILIGLVALVIGAVFGFSIHGAGVANLGTQVQNEAFNFTSGINVGSTNQLAVSSAGAVSTTGAITSTGLITANNLVQGGPSSVLSIATSSTAYTLTAAQGCSASTFISTPLAGALTVTLPATSTLFTTCLTSVGQFAENNINSVGTSTTIAAGAGGTLGYTSSATIAAGKYGLLRVVRDTANTYKAYLVNITN